MVARIEEAQGGIASGPFLQPQRTAIIEEPVDAGVQDQCRAGERPDLGLVVESLLRCGDVFAGSVGFVGIDPEQDAFHRVGDRAFQDQAGDGREPTDRLEGEDGTDRRPMTTSFSGGPAAAMTAPTSSSILPSRGFPVEPP